MNGALEARGRTTTELGQRGVPGQVPGKLRGNPSCFGEALRRTVSALDAVLGPGRDGDDQRARQLARQYIACKLLLCRVTSRRQKSPQVVLHHKTRREH